jgi:hypothetical protein
MKTKRKTADTVAKHGKPIACVKCGWAEFKRSLSENDSIIRLALAKDGKAVVEIIVSEGNLQFAYLCNKCNAPFLTSQNIPLNPDVG